MNLPVPPRTALTLALLLATGLSGCFQPSEFDHPLSETEFAVPEGLSLSGPVAASDLTWPDFSGATLRILDHGAFAAFDDAASRFENLTGAKVVHEAAADTGSALESAVRDRGDPQFDILYGVDNILMPRAQEAGIFQPYVPRLAARVPQEFVFFAAADWPATPVDHGYIALNVDPRHDGLDDVTVEDLFDVRSHADLFVTQDPRQSTPGLGFLLITVGVFGEDDSYDWLDYWNDLFDAGVKVVPDWGTAYETHFSGGYGVYTDGHVGDRPIVTSYTESPAYEAYFGAEEVADVLLTHEESPAVFRQVQTMGILKGTPNRAVAEAWIEFTLTDDFQELAAPQNAVYPVVGAVSADDVYGDVDPEPGEFEYFTFGQDLLGERLEGWVHAWETLCMEHDCI